MFRTLALLCLVAASALAGSWKGGLRVRYNLTIFGIGTDSFIEVPLSVASAVAKRWKQTNNSTLSAAYALLSIYCPEDDWTVCGIYDDTGYIAGLQVALDEDKCSGNTFDWAVQGFTYWTIDNNGTVQNYWATQQYFISPEFLATDSASRVAARNPDLLLQDKTIVVSGFNRELFPISTNVSDITGPNSDFTEQACIPWMGKHYYYKTTADLECKADTLLPWFPLVYSGQLIGLGFIAQGKYTFNDGDTVWFETPSKSVVKLIVPRGPQCLYELADSPGLITMHTYYIKHPYAVTCVF